MKYYPPTYKLPPALFHRMDPLLRCSNCIGCLFYFLFLKFLCGPRISSLETKNVSSWEREVPCRCGKENKKLCRDAYVLLLDITFCVDDHRDFTKIVNDFCRIAGLPIRNGKITKTSFSCKNQFKTSFDRDKCLNEKLNRIFLNYSSPCDLVVNSKFTIDNQERCNSNKCHGCETYDSAIKAILRIIADHYGVDIGILGGKCIQTRDGEECACECEAQKEVCCVLGANEARLYAYSEKPEHKHPYNHFFCTNPNNVSDDEESDGEESDGEESENLQ